jgi:hypothetical protein
MTTGGEQIDAVYGGCPDGYTQTQLIKSFPRGFTFFLSSTSLTSTRLKVIGIENPFAS